jgi:mono/diheme cytochrome c family protein
MGGLDLSSYEAAISGGDSGPAVEPGDPDGSELVALQAKGGHPGQFADDELDLIRQWIEDGALAAPASEAEAPPLQPAAGLVWADVGELFQGKCGACHGEANALGGLDLSTYASALAGGDSGPAIEPADPDTSGLVTLQTEGGHPGQFDDDELGLIRRWIADGALEAAAGTEADEPEEAPSAVSVIWQDDLADLFQGKCGACHSEANALGGLDLSSYASTLAGGNSGPVIEPGNSGASGLITLQAEGGHPGQFDDAELDLIRQWIEAGAPEE